MHRIEIKAMSQKRSGGFTLIELMIVLVVLGILAAIAIPAYTDSVRKTRRGQAKADMTTVVQAMERCFTNRSTYLLCFPTNTLPDPLDRSPGTGPNIFYDLSLQGVTAADYVVRAEPRGDQAQDLCGRLEIRQNGVRTTSSGRADCW
jgi:type IV pilus assembly protein PilE